MPLRELWVHPAVALATQIQVSRESLGLSATFLSDTLWMLHLQDSGHLERISIVKLKNPHEWP